MGAVIRTVCNGLRRKLHAGLIIRAVVRIRGERSDRFLKLLGRPEGELLTGFSPLPVDSRLASRQLEALSGRGVVDCLIGELPDTCVKACGSKTLRRRRS